MSFQSNFVHCIIAVSKDSPEVPERVFTNLRDFLLDAVEEMGARQLAAGGSADHIHLLISLPTSVALCTVISEIKGLSQRWLRATAKDCDGFRWEEGYTALSVGIPQVREAIAYIERQLECHRKIDYNKELLLFSEAYEFALSQVGCSRNKKAAIAGGLIQPAGY